MLLPKSLHALKQGAKEGGLDLRGAYLNRDGGCDSAHNRKRIFHADLSPNSKENPRNRQTPKRGRTRFGHGPNVEPPNRGSHTCAANGLDLKGPAHFPDPGHPWPGRM